MDWPVFSGDVFLALSAVMLMSAPLAGAAGPYRGVDRRVVIAAAVVCLGSLLLLAFGWRAIAGGLRAALFGELALIIGATALWQVGRLIRSYSPDALAASLIGFLTAVALTVGAFAAGPLLNDVPARLSTAVLFSNPLVVAASAAGIDILHLDVVYRLSPLAHRGVAVPQWTTACAVYAVVGFAAYGASRLRPWSH